MDSSLHGVSVSWLCVLPFSCSYSISWAHGSSLVDMAIVSWVPDPSRVAMARFSWAHGSYLVDMALVAWVPDPSLVVMAMLSWAYDSYLADQQL